MTPRELASATEAKWADRWSDRNMPAANIRHDLVGYIEQLIRAERDDADRRVKEERHHYAKELAKAASDAMLAVDGAQEGIARYVRSLSDSLYGGIADAIMLLGPSFGCRSRGAAPEIHTGGKSFSGDGYTTREIIPHRWGVGSRTCDNCGCDFDWAQQGQACGPPLGEGDERRLPMYRRHSGESHPFDDCEAPRGMNGGGAPETPALLSCGLCRSGVYAADCPEHGKSRKGQGRVGLVDPERPHRDAFDQDETRCLDCGERRSAVRHYACGDTRSAPEKPSCTFTCPTDGRCHAHHPVDPVVARARELGIPVKADTDLDAYDEDRCGAEYEAGDEHNCFLVDHCRLAPRHAGDHRGDSCTWRAAPVDPVREAALLVAAMMAELPITMQDLRITQRRFGAALDELARALDGKP